MSLMLRLFDFWAFRFLRRGALYVAILLLPETLSFRRKRNLSAITRISTAIANADIGVAELQGCRIKELKRW